MSEKEVQDGVTAEAPAEAKTPEPSGSGDAPTAAVAEEAVAKKPVPKAPKAPPKKPAAPPRELPTAEGVAAWVEGDDYPVLEALFKPLPVMKFDAYLMQLKKAELLPQHWQVISNREIPEGQGFESLPEPGRLRALYRDQEKSHGRMVNLELAWRALGGKQPSLWTVSDLFGAIRRLLDQKADVNYYELLSATRDVWRGMTLPHGREQLEILWACLDFIRGKTKK